MRRRTILTGAAWTVPVIAAAVATPHAAASEPASAIVCGGQAGDNGIYTITDTALIVTYRQRPDIIDINIHYADGHAQNVHALPDQLDGLTFTWPLQQRPTWVQVHGFNSHFGEPTCPVEERAA